MLVSNGQTMDTGISSEHKELSSQTNLENFLLTETALDMFLISNFFVVIWTLCKVKN